MPKKGKGKRNIKQPKNLDIKEADSRFDQEYAQVLQNTGDCSFKVVTVKKKEVTVFTIFCDKIAKISK